jgi:hypothetical protein
MFEEKSIFYRKVAWLPREANYQIRNLQCGCEQDNS